MKKFFTLFIGLFLISSSFSQPKVDADKLRKAFDAKLKDSVSARIKDVETPKKSIDGTIWDFCGMVNAKNSYGSYTGYQHFFASTDGNWYLVTAIGDNAKIACEMRQRVN